MKLIYIIGKYTSETRRGKLFNIKLAEEAGIKMLYEGYAVIIPHNNFRGHNEATNYNTVMKECYEIIRRVDAVYILPSWKDSKGSKKEIKLAQKLGKEIIWEEK